MLSQNLSLRWIRATSGKWLPLNTFDLTGVVSDGVYIIWHTGNPAKVVYVGQGDVAARLTSHRSNQKIQRYASAGRLMVTWASVGARDKDGVERYLADKWNPLVGDAHPQAAPIAVNSPW